jgi:hypothetical protein
MDYESGTCGSLRSRAVASAFLRVQALKTEGMPLLSLQREERRHMRLPYSEIG